MAASTPSGILHLPLCRELPWTLAPERSKRFPDIVSMQIGSKPDTPFQRILAANRGEIAIRIIRGGVELGLKTIAIYSPADRLHPHRFKADESYQVGTPEQTPVGCYLDYKAIVALAKQQARSQPGPLPETIEAMGDKTAARRLAIECGVAVVPGTDSALESAEEAKAFAAEAGYPVMIKARSGGGGRGMRVVRSDDEMEELFARASSEALAAFGDGGMFVEKYVEDPRHIEVQILADAYGNCVHLYERDCSVVEMAPAVGLPQEVKDRLFADAVRLAKHVGYRNAGTVEFMVDTEGRHFFLEVNPRIQVEHTVTEEITGVDLVQAQIRIAERGFQPDAGRISAYRSPGGPGIRLDGAMAAGNVVSRHYDSLLVKARGARRLGAAQKMQRALYEFHIRGIKTNILFLENVLRHPEFLAGQATTSFIERNAEELFTFGSKATAQSGKLLSYLAEMIVNGPKHPGAVGLPPAKLAVAPVPLPAGADEHLIPAGWRDYLLRHGPDAWAAAVRQHRRTRGVLITDTTMRDAHQSLLATRMRTHDMLKAAPATAHILANAGSLEMWGGERGRQEAGPAAGRRARLAVPCSTLALFSAAFRPGSARRPPACAAGVPNIPFQMLLRGGNAVGYTSYADNAVRAFVREARVAGVDIFRVFDSLNGIDQLKFGMGECRCPAFFTELWHAVRDAGGVVEGTLCYTGDCSAKNPGRYTLEYYLDLAEQMVEHGAHTLAIKDMAGLLKPRAATMLVGALREAFPDVPIHVHTHDTAGTGVATQLAAAAAGADMIDCAIDTMSGTTSQPSMGAIVHSLADTELDTGISPDSLLTLIDFWDATRQLYRPFEANLYTSSSEVYYHEMPGGQYTNLKFQASTLGLGEEWQRVKHAYAAANRALGDIVTPSSKVVGDLAQFMVANAIPDEHVLVAQAEQLSLPNSVIEYLQGYIGSPAGGFPEPLRSRVLKSRVPVEGRPGASLPPVDFGSVEAQLRERHIGAHFSQRDVLSYIQYPKVFDDYQAFVARYSTHVDRLPTRAFLAPLDVDEEARAGRGRRHARLQSIEVEVTRGNVEHIKYKVKGELQPDGMREVFFEVNGVPRMVEVREESEAQVGGAARRATRDKADPSNVGSVAAPMAGEVVEVVAAPGASVSAGQPLVVLSAMKMETSVAAPCSGTVAHVAVVKGDACENGDLLLLIAPAEAAEAASGSGNGAAQGSPPAAAPAHV
eukprot:scaffold26.g3326.t1